MVLAAERRLALGQSGEQLARKFLQQQGYKIKETNFKVPLGEIDIIAEHKGDLVFIEVKTRSGLGFGTPAEAVTLRKQRQIIRVAQYYLALKKGFDLPARFDVVAVLLGKDQKVVIEVIENAFEQQ
jgi:putative endonuclease